MLTAEAKVIQIARQYDGPGPLEIKEQYLVTGGVAVGWQDFNAAVTEYVVRALEQNSFARGKR